MQAPPRVLVGRVLDQQVKHLGELLLDVEGRVNSPPEGSAAWQDLEHVNRHVRRGDLMGLRWWAHVSAHRTIHAMAEHAKGLRMVVTGEELLPIPAMALGRSVYEAAINIFWLIESAVPVEQRLARWAGQLLHDSQETPAVLDSFGSPETTAAERSKTLGARELGQKLMSRGGFELTTRTDPDGLRTDRVVYRGEASGLTPKVHVLTSRFSFNNQMIWPLFSGAAHSRGWFVAGLEGDERTILTSVVSPLLDASDAFVEAVCGYFDMDPTPVIERTHARRTALLQMARPHNGPKVGWADYRAAGGAPPPN